MNGKFKEQCLGVYSGRLKGDEGLDYDPVTGTSKTSESNPLSLQYTPIKITLSASSDSNYIDMDGYGEASIDIDISAGSVGIQVSNNYEDDCASITTWHDVDTGISADKFVRDDDLGCCKWIKISASTATAVIYVKRKQKI
jgi:hypothetical protein